MSAARRAKRPERVALLGAVARKIVLYLARPNARRTTTLVASVVTMPRMKMALHLVLVVVAMGCGTATNGSDGGADAADAVALADATGDACPAGQTLCSGSCIDPAMETCCGTGSDPQGAGRTCVYTCPSVPADGGRMPLTCSPQTGGNISYLCTYPDGGVFPGNSVRCN